MARRLVRLELDVLVVDGSITLLDDGGPEAIPDVGGDQWLETGRNAIVLASAGQTDHFAALAIEVWDGPPDRQAPVGWDGYRDRVVDLDSGDLEVHPLVAPPGTQILRVGPTGRYHVRAHVAGRAELAACTPNPDIHALRGLERFLLQLWSARQE